MTTSFDEMRANANRCLDGMTCNVQKMARNQIELLDTVARLTAQVQQKQEQRKERADRADHMRDIFGDSNIFAGTSSAFQGR